ncbi:MAG TPA: hypothetical protein VGE40_02705 [Bacilli bacterium]
MKRLSFADYMLTLFFIFMLVLSVGSFFFGVQTGKERTEMKYEQLLKPRAAPQELGSYHQQYLVSFYHTIYLPYRDFQKKWFAHLEDIELQSKSVEPVSLLKELRKLADEKYETIATVSMPATSPLLKDAQNNYLKSLKLFLNTLNGLQGVEELKGKEIVDLIDNGPSFQEAKNFALQAQYNYYSAMNKWQASLESKQAKLEDLTGKNVSISKWSQLNLATKNEITAELLYAGKHYADYYPQDLTIRIDGLILSGQAAKMKLTDTKRIVEMLINTGAVRPGDFLKSKNKYYANSSLPLLPFFYE